MANQEGLWAELNSTFERDIPVTAEMLDLLQSERQALEDRNYDIFQQILDRKKELLAVLEQNAHIRQQLLLNAGFNDEPSTLRAAEQQAPTVATAWHRLGEQWKQCQELNEINEHIAQRTRLVVGQILDLLRGTSGEPRIYDNKGCARPSGGGNTITNA